MTEMMVFRVAGDGRDHNVPLSPPVSAVVTLLVMRTAIVRGSTIWKISGPARTQGPNGPDEEITI